MSDQALLALKDITKNYGAVRALDGVSFEVNAGEIVALVGDNGAGKSSTVKVIAGAVQPDGGRVFFDGEERHWASPRQAQESGIETLYQDMGLAPHLSVSANIFLGRELRRKGLLGRLGFMDNDAMSRRAHEEIEKLKVNVPGGEYATEELSGGQRQAVAIAKSMAWASKLILLDEPTNHLGVQGVGQVLDVLRRIRDLGLGVLLVSHTIPHVLEVSDRIVVLWQGHVATTLDAASTDIDEVVREITGGSAAA